MHPWEIADDETQERREWFHPRPRPAGPGLWAEWGPILVLLLAGAVYVTWLVLGG